MSETFDLTQLPYIDVKGQLHNAKQTGIRDYVLVPSEQVMMTEVVVPGKRKNDWMQALPYALEEALAQPVEDLFFAVYDRQTNGEAFGKTQVAVVEKERLRNWVEELKAHDLASAQLIPDCFVVPAAENTWQTFSTEQKTYVRTEAFAGFAGEAEWVDQLVELQRQKQPGLQLTALEPSELQPLKADEIKRLGLRQGTFQPVSSSNSIWKHWRWPIAVTTIFLVILLADLVLTQVSLEQQRQAYTDQTRALFKQMFPQTKRIVNIRAQTKANMMTSDADGKNVGLAAMLFALEPFIRPYLDRETIAIDQVSWYKQALKIELNANNVETLQKLTDSLQNEFKVDMELKKLSAGEGKERVEGVLNVRPI